MYWLKWIFAYLFDCVHPHTTWPHRNRAGLVYVCCVDCGRELPYSLEWMSIIREDRIRKTWDTRSAVAASRILVSALLLLSSARAAAQTAATQTSDRSAQQTQLSTTANGDTAPTLVIGFVGGFVHIDDQRHSEVRLARDLQATYRDRTQVELFQNHQTAQAERAILTWLNNSPHGADAGEPPQEPRIVLFGHSWGASAVVYLARQLDRDGVPVALTIQVDSVQRHREDDSVIPANVAEAVNFYQSKGLIHGRSRIVAADPSRTKILGNFQFKYHNAPAGCRIFPWYDRLFFKSHISIECDPRVWSQVETLIEARLPALQPAQTEVAAQFVK
jgi:hypothetical protein